MDSTAILAAVFGGVPAVVAAIFAYRSSAQANAVSVKKVDAEAYERSQQFYEKLIAEADKQMERLRLQVDRLNDQVDRVNSQLAQEQDVSNALRNHVRTLTAQVGSMEMTLAELRVQIDSGRAQNRSAVQVIPQPSQRPGR